MNSIETFENFIKSMTIEALDDDRFNILSWYQDDNNYVGWYVSADTLILRVREGGVNNDATVSFPIDIGDIITLVCKKEGQNLSLEASKNGGVVTPLSNTTTLTGHKKFAVSSFVNNDFNVLSDGVTTLPHSDTCNTAEVAKRTLDIYKNGAFTVEELSYGQRGIDTANNRVYWKFSNTQLIYVNGTLV
jgi:hypothetical protein